MFALNTIYLYWPATGMIIRYIFSYIFPRMNKYQIVKRHTVNNYLDLLGGGWPQTGGECRVAGNVELAQSDDLIYW